MEIMQGVFLLKSPKGCHVYYIADEKTLIDTGMPGQAGNILDEIRKINNSNHLINRILLTHHDIDHIGNVAKIQRETRAEVWAAKEDAPYILGEMNRQGIKRIIQSVFRPHAPSNLHLFGPDTEIKEIQIIPASGHTPGHTMFLYHKALFVGDLITNRHGKLGLLPGFMNWDMHKLKKSISMLQCIDFTWMCPSHGRPTKNNTTLQRFIKDNGSSI